MLIKVLFVSSPGKKKKKKGEERRKNLSKCFRWLNYFYGLLLILPQAVNKLLFRCEVSLVCIMRFVCLVN